MSPFESVLEALSSRDLLCSPPREPGEWSEVRCPSHDDKAASLGVKQGDDGGVLLKCHAGCDFGEIRDALGLEARDLIPEHKRHKPTPPALYTYCDETGAPLYQVRRSVRDGRKSFSQARFNGREFVGGKGAMRGVRKILYRLPEVLEAIAAGRRVYLVEGEKDADNVAGLGLVATTPLGGSGKWLKSYAESLRGADVVILADNDPKGAKPSTSFQGQKHAAKVAAALEGVARTVRAVLLPGLPPNGDVSDWIEAGGSRIKLEAIALGAPLGVPAGFVPEFEAAEPEAEVAAPPSGPPEDLEAGPGEPDPEEVEDPLDHWGIYGGRLVEWVPRGTGKKRRRVPVARFRGIPELAHVDRSEREDPERPGEWILEERLRYRFDLADGPEVNVIAGPGAKEFCELLGESRLAGANATTTGTARALLYQWTSRRRHSVEESLAALGDHGRRGWIAPGACVREGRVIAPELGYATPHPDPSFRRFRLASITDDEAREAAAFVARDLLTCDHAEGGYTLPLLGAFMAPALWASVPLLATWQRYVAFIWGQSGTGKTTLARHFWCFWGDFRHGDGLPTWASSTTYLEGVLHHASLAPVFTSDWKRANFSREGHRAAIGLIQGYADRSSRGRAQRGGSSAAPKATPRATWIVDGEHLPEGEQSTLGRLVALEVKPGPGGLCAEAHPGNLPPRLMSLLPGLTARWIAAAQRNGEAFEAELIAALEWLSGTVLAGEAATNTSRLARAYAVQVATVRCFLRFLELECAAGDLSALAIRSDEIHADLARNQVGVVSCDSVGEQFLRSLSGLLASERLCLKVEGNDPLARAQNPFMGRGTAPAVGTVAIRNGAPVVSLWPDVALREVNALRRDGQPLNAREVASELESSGLIETGGGYRRVGSHGHPTRSRLRVWSIDLDVLESTHLEAEDGAAVA